MKSVTGKSDEDIFQGTFNEIWDGTCDDPLLTDENSNSAEDQTVDPIFEAMRMYVLCGILPNVKEVGRADDITCVVKWCDCEFKEISWECECAQHCSCDDPMLSTINEALDPVHAQYHEAIGRRQAIFRMQSMSHE